MTQMREHGYTWASIPSPAPSEACPHVGRGEEGGERGLKKSFLHLEKPDFWRNFRDFTSRRRPFHVSRS